MNFKIKCAIIFLAILLSAMIFFKQGFARFQERRQHELDNVAGLENSKKSYIPKVFHSITGKSTGLIKSIVYSKDLSSIVISDNNNILHENNTIHGVKIVKIHEDKVEFAKNGQTWTQKLGQTPNLQWYK
jgi:uncharacterized protein YpmB